MSTTTPEQRKEWRELRGQGMTSAVGEYTPSAFWDLLDDVDDLAQQLAQNNEAGAQRRQAAVDAGLLPDGLHQQRSNTPPRRGGLSEERIEEIARTYRNPRRVQVEVMLGIAAAEGWINGARAMPSESKEWTPGDPRVVCAALRRGDTIICGPRHWDSLCRGTSKDGWEQGFVDQRGNFLTRENAWKVAEAQGQIIRRCGGDGERLYSENLY